MELWSGVGGEDNMPWTQISYKMLSSFFFFFCISDFDLYIFGQFQDSEFFCQFCPVLLFAFFG